MTEELKIDNDQATKEMLENNEYKYRKEKNYSHFFMSIYLMITSWKSYVAI